MSNYQHQHIQKKRPRKETGRDWCIEKMVYVLTIVIFITIVMPMWIAPDIMHVSPEDYEKNSFMFTTLAGIMAIPVAAIVARILNGSGGK